MWTAGQDRAAQFDEIMTHVEQELGAAAGAYLMSVCLAAMRRPNDALRIIKQTEEALHFTIQQIDVAQRLAEGAQGSDEEPTAAEDHPRTASPEPTGAADLTRSNSTSSETTAELKC
jgi:hypothetical protein